MLKRLRKLLGRKTDGPIQEESAAPIAGADLTTPRTMRAQVHGGLPAVHHGPQVVPRPIPAVDLDQDAVKIVRRLTRFDHAGYLVGGCVRDLLLDRKPKDFDVATSATPRQVKRLFSNCRIIGRRFRLAHIYFQSGKIIEVATFRAGEAAEGEGEEAAPGDDLMIRDDNVFGTPEQDALRRDFTINALFYDVNQETVIDHVNGLEDLRKHLVRTIGDPAIRFREDPIRILRAVKFAARLDFQFEPATRRAMEDLREEINKAATARVLEEINRFCRGGAARKSFELLRETDILAVILPELAPPLTEDEHAWRVAVALLDGIDAECARGAEISTGGILARLIFPLLAPRMGIAPDGRITPGARINPREAADDFLRPMSLRLRVSRRDQEECRQIAMTIQRMLAFGGLKRGMREALIRRPAFAESLRILADAVPVYDGKVAEAVRYWTEAAGGLEPKPAADHEVSGALGEGADGARRGRRRRGRRRGGRSREGRPVAEGQQHPASEGQPAAERPVHARAGEGRPARERHGRGRGPRGGSEGRPPGGDRATADRPTDPNLPPVWDDRYFFAALPTASSEAGSADPGDRYGAAVAAPEATPAAEEPEFPSAAMGTERKRRRRGGARRSRSRARSAQDAGVSGEGDVETEALAPATESAADDEPSE